MESIICTYQDVSFLVYASLTKRAIVCFNRAFSISRPSIRVLSTLPFCEMIAESTNTVATILLTFVFLRTPAFVRASSEASEFGQYCRIDIACVTSAFFLFDTQAVPLRTRDTVATETPACLATSFIVHDTISSFWKLPLLLAILTRKSKSSLRRPRT